MADDPLGSFSGLARGLTELSSALLTIARALQQLAPHPANASAEGPVVSDGPDAVVRGESTETPRRGAEPRPAALPRGRTKPASLQKISPWSDARDAYLAEAWARGDEPAAILSAINAIAGAEPVASELAIRAMASKRKLRRSAEALARARERAAAKSAKPRKWTADAVALVRQQYPDKRIPVEDIAAAVSQMLGVAMSADGVMHFCQKHRIIRPRGQVAGRAVGGPRKLDRWSDERRALLRTLWTKEPRLTQTQMAAELSKLPGLPLSGHQAGIYGLCAMNLPKRGLAPRVDEAEQAAAAAQARDTSAPPAPEAAPAAPPASLGCAVGTMQGEERCAGGPPPALATPSRSGDGRTTEIPRAALTNPAREMAVSAGQPPRPDTQSSAAAGGAPRLSTFPPPPPLLGFTQEEAAEAAAMVRDGKSGRDIAAWFDTPIELTGGWVSAVRQALARPTA